MVINEGQSHLVFLFACRILLSQPSSILFQFLLHRWTLRRPHSIDNGGLLSSEIPWRPLMARRSETEGLGEFSVV